VCERYSCLTIGGVRRKIYCWLSVSTPGLPRECWWNCWTVCLACLNFSAGYKTSLCTAEYSLHLARTWRLLVCSRDWIVSSCSYSSPPSLRIGEGGSLMLERNLFSCSISKRKMWKVLGIAIACGKACFYVLVPILAQTFNSIMLFSSNFFAALLVLILCGTNQTIYPDCRFASGFQY